MTNAFTRSLPLAVLTLFALCALPFAAVAQSATATLSGTVEDQNGAVVPGVVVAILNVDTSLRREATTTDGGSFVFTLLPPGRYALTAEHQGFKTASIPNVILNVGDEKAFRIQLKTGNISETVNVSAESPLINESPAVGTVVDRTQVENMPLNGRSFQSLITLTPGIVLATSAAAFPGQFSANGQRSYSNYFTVDGVSANLGVRASTNSNPGFSGTQPALTAQGSTQGLVAVDALQEFRIQTSGYAPEFGRSPGAQVQLLTRSGTNQFHGTLFDYLRNDVFDANDWFANANRLAKSPLRQNDFGGTFSGPILLPRFGEGGHQPGYNGRNKTFFFFSYEGLRLRQPQFALRTVPALTTRQTAPAALQPFLNAFPLPNGPILLTTTGQPTGFAQFADSHSDPSVLNATSVRIDHNFNGRFSLFGRFADTPSHTSSRVLSNVTTTTTNTQTLTVGSTMMLGSKLINELRGNVSRAIASSTSAVDSFGGAVPPSDQILFSPLIPADTGFTTFNFTFSSTGASSTSFSKGNGDTNRQRQINIVDSLSLTAGEHSIKFGLDYRRIFPILSPPAYNLALAFSSLTDLLNGRVTGGGVSSTVSTRPVFVNWSFFAQDAWRVRRRLTLTYGVRWEINPTPHNSNGPDPVALTGLDNPANYALAPAGTPIYSTRYNDFAPRFGIAYQLRQRSGWETMVRGGIGLFYDLGNTQAAASSNGFPNTNSKSFSGLQFQYPLTAAQLTLPPVSLTPPFAGTFFVYGPNFNLPYTVGWNVAVEQALGANQALTVSYVGNFGRRYLRQELENKPNANFTSLVVIFRDDSTSDYDALQLQFQRRLSRGLQVLASYTYAHAIDNLSSESTGAIQAARANSDFDVRHNFASAVSYNIPSIARDKIARAVFGNWGLDVIFHGQTSSPVNLAAGTTVVGPLTFQVRPDLVPNVPLYIADPTVAGGRRFNTAAFVKPPAGRQGTLGRNVLRGLPISQLDVALRRQFSFTERLKLQLRGEAFNILNHPNFGALSTTVGSTTLGVPTSMLGRALGGLSPVYQIGGPRSMQFSLKLIF